MIEVFGVDVGDDGDRRDQMEKRAIRFVGLRDEQVARTGGSARAERVQLSADDDRGIEPRPSQNGRDQRGGGRLAMRPGNRDAILQPHQLAEHLGARNDRHARSSSLGELGIGGGTADEKTTTSASAT